MPIDGTDIIGSIPAIGRLLWFPMNVAMVELPNPINDTSRATVSYLQKISKNSRFAQDLVTWLIVTLRPVKPGSEVLPRSAQVGATPEG